MHWAKRLLAYEQEGPKETGPLTQIPTSHANHSINKRHSRQASVTYCFAEPTNLQKLTYGREQFYLIREHSEIILCLNSISWTNANFLPRSRSAKKGTRKQGHSRKVPSSNAGHPGSGVHGDLSLLRLLIAEGALMRQHVRPEPRLCTLCLRSKKRF